MRHSMSPFLLVLALTIVGCVSSSADRMTDYGPEPSMEQASGIIARDSATDARRTLQLNVGSMDNAGNANFIADYDVEAGNGEAPAVARPERLLIYSGSMDVAVGNVDESLEAARAMAEDLGGYFQSLSDHTITLRVPAARWEEALARVAEIGRILNRRIDAADVTEEVVDLELRLRNSRALGQRLEELLAMAKTVEETLKVETELNRVRTEIERLEGRLAFLTDRIAYSTLVLNFVEVGSAPTRPQALPFPWLRDLGLNSLLGLSGGAL